MSKRRWSVSGAVVGGTFVGDYEAETGQEAIEMARGDADVSICRQCSGNISDLTVERLVAECGGETVEDEPDEDWQDKARAAGWTPPKRARKTKGKVTT